MKWSVAGLSADLESGRTTSRALVEEALARIADPAGEGARAFMKVYADTARAEADFSDRLRGAGIRRSRIDGLPVSLKDLYDVAGDVTRAGSVVLDDAPPAAADAPAVARLRGAGAVIIGRTNMVEFAFGSIGLNPHYGTPRNPWDRATGRIPGGSSSGAGVAQADGMCVMALGSDTRGSVRIPAALCGVAGYKPTAHRIPREGVFPLSYSLDSVGPLANTVACCASYDAIMAGEPDAPLPTLPVRGLRLLVPRTVMLEDLDAKVASDFASACTRLSAAGALIDERDVPPFAAHETYFRGGGLVGAESYAIHRPRLDRVERFDPRVGKRVLTLKDAPAWEYVELLRLRDTFRAGMAKIAAPYDAMLMPTVPSVAPPIAETDASDEAYFRWLLRMLRNVGLINFLDGCAATLPCHAPGSGPVGLMVAGTADADRHVLAVAAAIEGAVGTVAAGA